MSFCPTADQTMEPSCMSVCSARSSIAAPPANRSFIRSMPSSIIRVARAADNSSRKSLDASSKVCSSAASTAFIRNNAGPSVVLIGPTTSPGIAAKTASAAVARSPLDTSPRSTSARSSPRAATKSSNVAPVLSDASAALAATASTKTSRSTKRRSGRTKSAIRSS